MSITNRVPLKSIASFSKGEQINGDLLLKDGTYPYLNGGINPSGMWDEYNVAADTVTISEGGNSCGYVNYMNTPFWCGAHCYYLFDVKCDVKFLYHALKSSQNKLMSLRSGACMPNIKKKDLGEFEIPEPPPLETQREIAYNLDKAAETVDICRKILEKLDVLVKAKFTEMFGDFKTNPMHWQVVSFTEFAIIDGNMTTDYEKYADYPHIGIDCIEKDTGELKNYRTVAEDNVISGKYIFTPKHIIYSKIRPNLNKVAIPDFYGVCSADAYPILPIENVCNRIFLAYNMRSPYFLDYILQFCDRTNLPKVNRKEVSGFKSPLPPLPLQEQFAEYVKKTDLAKSAVKKALERAETLKSALMQKYFG